MLELLAALVFTVGGTLATVYARSHGQVRFERRLRARHEALSARGLTTFDDLGRRYGGTVDGFDVRVSLPLAMGERFIVSVACPSVTLADDAWPKPRLAGEWTVVHREGRLMLAEAPRMFAYHLDYTGKRILDAVDVAIDLAREASAGSGYR